jgi:hypothetical protein
MSSRIWLWERVSAFNEWIPVRWATWLAIIGWSTVWVVVAVRHLRRCFPFTKLIVALGLCCFLIAGASIGISRISAFDGIAIAKMADLYQADGDTFPVVGSLTEGQRLNVIERRGGWLKIEATNGTVTGWLREDLVYVLRG